MRAVPALATVDGQIRATSKTICDNIEALGHDRDLLARNVIKHLRDLVEAVSVRLMSASGQAEFKYDLISPAMDWVGSAKKNVNFLSRFHKRLQMSASHYSFEGDASERLMLKYFADLVRTRQLVRDQIGLDILENLEDFPVNLDPSLAEYHTKIADRLEISQLVPGPVGERERYYIHRVKPFYTGGKIYYEVTFANVMSGTNKSGRIIGFTHIDLTDRYAANLTLVEDSIEVLDRTMPITIVTAWEVSVRPCEFDNFAKILGQTTAVSSSSSEYRALMSFLTDTFGSLLDLMDMSDQRYAAIREYAVRRVQAPRIFPVLDAARTLVRSNAAGTNVLRYLMLQMNNRLIKLQYDSSTSRYLSNLHLTNKSGPFDSMPFCANPRGHVPRLADLTESLDPSGREHEFLARHVKRNVEQGSVLYTPLEELQAFDDVESLIEVHNKKLPPSHSSRILELDKGSVFLRGYEEDATAIILELQKYANAGVAGYEQAIERWLAETQLDINDDVKRDALRTLFARSRVALIYGAAGTGKTTIIDYIANYFGGNRKLLLAHTHPAKDNLVRRVNARNTEIRTVNSQAWRGGKQPDYDVLIIDECSIISNSDFLKVLGNTTFKLLVLVGDVYQIEAIQFGNWFDIAQSFVPASSVSELTTPYRTKSAALLDFWTKVRYLHEGIDESIAQHGYSKILGESLFEAQSGDEIILCLNYDGLYGINNVNRFLQSSNKGKSVVWGATTYKVGDPVLFSEGDRFKPLIFNNLKGRITAIEEFADRVQFDVWLDRSVTAIDVDGDELRYVDDSTVRFDVYRRGSTDEDVDVSNATVPFQVAYAVSIHKAQGLEYESVKVVITDANEDNFSHSIFYTAITRARERLQIYWTPETQQAVLSQLRRSDNARDAGLLTSRNGLQKTS